MEDLFDVLEHLVRHARGYATIADRDAHLHILAELRRQEASAQDTAGRKPEEE